mgnify:CR=1 FL=1
MLYLSDAFIRRKYIGIDTTVIEEKNTNMASADDSSGIPSLPAPVPPRGNDGKMYRNGLLLAIAGQNWPPAAADTRNQQTQARRVE